MKKYLGLAALTTAAALSLTACGGSGAPAASSAPVSAGSAAASDPAGNADKTITLWLAGGDTPEELRTYLKDTFKTKTGATLKIEEQGWGDLVTKMTTALPDAENTPDVVEIGNTQSPTFTNIGAFLDVSDMFEELGGAKLIPSFVEVGAVDGKNFTLPYYFGSRYMFQRERRVEGSRRRDPHDPGRVQRRGEDHHREEPARHQELLRLLPRRPGLAQRHLLDLRQRRRPGQEGRRPWVSTLSDPNTLKGLAQLQDLYKSASKAPADAKDATPWLYINDADQILDEAGKPTGKTSLAAATIMAPGWAHWSIGDLEKDAKTGKDVRTWNDKKFGAFVLPGDDGKPAPVSRRRLQHRHLRQVQEPGAGQGADADHLLLGLPGHARQERPRPGELATTTTRSVTTSSPRRPSPRPRTPS